MTFSEAVRDGFAQYATFIGRSSRSAYWWWWLFSLIVVVATVLVDLALGTRIISGLVSLALLLPDLSVLVRRLHDTGHSGWWILISLVPLIGAIVLLVFTLQASEPPNRWGHGPGTPAPAPAV
jgi:uncharacterized membrane protein YhaH (DUF805 family)